MATRAAFASSSSSRPSTTAARRDARASAVAVRVRARDGEIGSGRDATSSSSSRRLCHLHRRPASTLRGALQRVRALHRGTLVWTLPPEMTRSTPTPTLVWPASAHGARGERAGAGAGAGAAGLVAMSSSSSSSNLSSSDPPPAAALTTSPSSNPPVTGGPILTPKRPPAAWTKRRVPEGGEETRPGEEGGDRVQNYHDQNVARWNSWWVDAVAANNTEALDMLAKMPWSDVRVIVSSMRMMAGKPDVFEAVVRGVCRRADGVETVESVGGLTTLAWAAKYGNVRAIEACVLAGADVDARDSSGATPTLHAAMANAVPAVEALLNAGADPNGAGWKGDGAGWTPLTWCARKGQISALKLLLSRGADVDEYGGGNRTTPLTHAAMGGHVEAAVALRERGADASRRDADGFTASMHAGYRHPRDVALAAAVADAVADVEPK